MADAAGMPIVPGTRGPVDLAQAKKEAARIGFPLLVKAAFGGGGKGMHVVRDADHLEESLKRAAREAKSYFGRPEVFLERYVDRAHHVEAQIVADTHGNVFFLGERDCSVQRRHQKLIEETPSPLFDDRVRERFAEAATGLAREAGYVNAGTIECVMDEDGDFYFLEMNTRLQVEHTVTEMVTGLDLVALQIRVALGERLRLGPGSPRGVDPVPHQRRGPRPQLPPGPRSGHAVSGAGRPVRAGRLRGSSRAGRSPATTTRCSRSSIVSGQDREDGADADAPRARRVRGRRRPDHDPGASLDPRVEGVPSRHAHDHVAGARARRRRPPGASRTSRRRARRRTGRRTSSSRWTAGGSRSGSSTSGGSPRRARPTSPDAHHGEHVHGEILAPMQGTIVKVLVEKGQEVRPGDVICILEAMKMENHVPSTRDGEVTDLPIHAGQVVETGQVLAVID